MHRLKLEILMAMLCRLLGSLLGSVGNLTLDVYTCGSVFVLLPPCGLRPDVATGMAASCLSVGPWHTRTHTRPCMELLGRCLLIVDAAA